MTIGDRFDGRAAWRRMVRWSERLERAARRQLRPGAMVRAGDRVVVRRVVGDVERMRIVDVVDVDGGRRLVLEPTATGLPGWMAVALDSMLAASVTRPGDVLSVGSPRRDGPTSSAIGAIGRPRPDGTAGMMQFMPLGRLPDPPEPGSFGAPSAAYGEYLRRRYAYWSRPLPGSPGRPAPNWLQECVDAIVATYRRLVESARRDLAGLEARLRVEREAWSSEVPQAQGSAIDAAIAEMREQRIGGLSAAAVFVDETRTSPSVQAAISASVLAEIRRRADQDALRGRYRG